MKIRRVVSLTSALTFITMLITSVMLFIVPEGRVAHWANWTMLGLNKEQWAEVHTNLGILFLITLTCHIYLNWKAIKAYLNSKTSTFKFFSKEFNSSALIVTAFFLGTYFHIAPFSSILQLSEDIKHNAASQYGDPPFGGAQRASIEELAARLQLNLDQGLVQLKDSGFKIEDTSMTLEELAEINHTTPQKIYLAMMSTQPSSSSAEPSRIQPPSSGLGRITLQELNQQYGVNLENALLQLQAQNSTINDNMRLRDIADLLGQSPEEVFNQLAASSAAHE